MIPLRLLLIPLRLLLLCVAGLLAAGSADAALPTVRQYAKFEASFTLPNQTGNPFDPADNDIDVAITGPNKKTVIQFAFWDGDRWRVRYTPIALGAYTLAFTRNGVAVSPLNLSATGFNCTRGRNPGFIRRDPTASQQLIFDAGVPYYPLGMDLAWQDGSATAYPQAFQQMRAAGMNWARIWMNHWDGKNLEWASDKSQSPPPGTLLISVARYWDSILTAAEQNGIYIQMTLQHHGQYTNYVDPNWVDNPFNVANGGFLQNPDDFFTDAQARRLTRNKYRYITARYGYSTHLLSYELFNEVQNITEVQSHFQDVVNWHTEMAAAIRAEDVNHHLVTTSNSVPGTPLAQIGLDYNQTHIYTDAIIPYFSALAGDSTPVFTGEFGAADTQTEAVLHDGLWSSLMAPTAGAAQFWFWDLVMANNWWPQFSSASSFLQSYVPHGSADMTALPVTVQTPGASSDLSFAPYGGYSTATRSTVTVPTDGSSPDLSGIPSYIQGNYHRSMTPNPIVFVLNCAAADQFRMDIGQVASSGAHPVLYVDGVKAAELNLPASTANYNSGQTLSVAVPAGAHQVGIYNTGNDWFVVNNLTVTSYVPTVAVRAKGNSHAALFWAYTQNRTGTASGPILSFTGLNSGVYTVRLWDPWTSQTLAPLTVSAQGGQMQVVLPSFSRDLAGSLSQAGS